MKSLIVDKESFHEITLMRYLEIVDEALRSGIEWWLKVSD